MPAPLSRCCAAIAAAGALASAHAGLTLADTARLAREQAPALAAQHSTLAGARALQTGAGTLPDPRLIAGVDNLPVSGPERWSLTRDAMTMQRIGLMQDVPNRAKRAAREAGASARVERDRAQLAALGLAVQREAMLAWLAVHAAESRLAPLDALERENQLLRDTLDARIAGGRALPAEAPMARQEALALADRRDDALRDIARARAALRRFVGTRADEPLEGDGAVADVSADRVRAELHRHAEIAPYAPMQAMAEAQAREADAEGRGDWGWEVVYARRPQYGDMVSLQLTFDLPWQRARRQQPQVMAAQRDSERIQAEREDTLRRHGEEVEAQLAELQALERQHARLSDSGVALAEQRVALALAAYQAGRSDLGAVLAARREALDTRLRLIDLSNARAALRVRLSTLVEP